MVRVCGVVRFLERFCHCEMQWTQQNVIEFIELYQTKEIRWDPKHQMHFNKIKKQDAWEKLEKNEQTRR
jgi:hypothetical protein